MPGNVVFLDTNGWLALINASDQLHQTADAVWQDLGRRGYSIVLTDWVIAETGNGLARTRARERFYQVVDGFMKDPRCRVVFITAALLRRALDLYLARGDKQWGLVDCSSFLVMTEEKILEALTNDRHFDQAGFGPCCPSPDTSGSPSTLGQLRDCQTLLRVSQDGFDLFARHTLKPFEEIINRCAAFKILEERRHRNPRAFEKPSSADLSRHALDRRTVAPIQHGDTLSLHPPDRKDRKLKK